MKSLPAILLAAAILTLARCAVLAQSSPGLALQPASAPAASPASGLALPAASSPSAQSLQSSSATEEPPADPDTAFTTGLAAYENGNYALARKNFAAAERTASSFALEYNLGNACYQTGDQAAAILITCAPSCSTRATPPPAKISPSPARRSTSPSPIPISSPASPTA